jgi:hypothetical protein
MIKYFEDKDKAMLGKLTKSHVEQAASDTLKALENDKWEKDV